MARDFSRVPQGSSIIRENFGYFNIAEVKCQLLKKLQNNVINENKEAAGGKNRSLFTLNDFTAVAVFVKHSSYFLLSLLILHLDCVKKFPKKV